MKVLFAGCREKWSSPTLGHLQDLLSKEKRESIGWIHYAHFTDKNTEAYITYWL